MRVVKNVANEGELVACVARNGDTAVELSLEEPTRGSLLLLFCQRSSALRGAFSPPQLRGVLGNLDRDLRLIWGGTATHTLPPQVLHEAHEDSIGHCGEQPCA